MKVMLLAAGKGTRMLPLTATTPKPLLQAGGRSLIEHQIIKLRNAGFTEFVINHAWLGEQLEQALGDGSNFGVSINWSREGEPLETAGGILQALPLLGPAPFLVVNADIWTDFDFARLRTALIFGGLVHLVLVPNPDQHPQGDFSLVDGKLRQPQAGAVPRWTYSGIGVYNPSLFAGLNPGKYPLLPLLQRAIATDDAIGTLHQGEWEDIGTPERLQALDARLR